MSEMNIDFEALERQLQELENTSASLLEVSKSLAKGVIDALLWGNKDSYAIRLCRIVPQFKEVLSGIFGNTVRIKADSLTVLAPVQARELYKTFRAETKLNWDLALQYFAEAKAEKATKAKEERTRRALNATEAEVLEDLRRTFERLQKKYVNVDLRSLWDKI